MDIVNKVASSIFLIALFAILEVVTYYLSSRFFYFVFDNEIRNLKLFKFFMLLVFPALGGLWYLIREYVQFALRQGLYDGESTAVYNLTTLSVVMTLILAVIMWGNSHRRRTLDLEKREEAHGLRCKLKRLEQQVSDLEAHNSDCKKENLFLRSLLDNRSDCSYVPSCGDDNSFTSPEVTEYDNI